MKILLKPTPQASKQDFDDLENVLFWDGDFTTRIWDNKLGGWVLEAKSQEELDYDFPLKELERIQYRYLTEDAGYDMFDVIKLD